MPSRSRSTSIRPFARLLDASPRPAWAFDGDGALVYLSSACSDWLNVPLELLLGRKGTGPASPSAGSEEHDADEERALDALVQALGPPPGLPQRNQLTHRLHLPALRMTDAGRVERAASQGEPTTALFIALDDSTSPVTFGIAGPFHSEPLTPDVQSALLVRETLDRWRASQPALSELPLALGASRQAERLRAQARLAAATTEHLLLIGPPGCGSVAVATTIHAGAIRQGNSPPLVTVEGALMDAELLDATIGPAIAWLTENEKRHASLLVTEIDQMPADAQLRLNQWVDQFAPRLRLLALSSRPARLSEEAISGSPESFFQPPLACKLDVLAVDVPSLQERAEDIPLIATALLTRRRAAGEGRAEQFSRAATDALILYPWPGDFNELDAAVRQAIRNCRGSSIQPDHLPLAVRTFRPHDPDAHSQQTPIDLDQTLRNVERQLIRRALQQSDDNRAEAARRLNISRARLLRRLGELEQEKTGNEGG